MAYIGYGIRTSRTRALQNRLPRWPWTFNRDSIQSQGLIGWWPIIDWPGVGPVRNHSALGSSWDLTNVGTDVSLETSLEFPVASSGSEPNIQSAVWGLVPGLAGYVSDTSPKPYSMMAWLRTDTTSQVSPYGIATDGDAGTNAFNARIAITTREFRFKIGTRNPSAGVMGSDVWHHTSGNVIQTNEVYAILDGVSGAVVTTANTPWTGDRIGFGILLDSSPSLSYPGEIYDMRLYSAADTRGWQERITEPSVRWELWYELGRRTYFIPSAGADIQRDPPAGSIVLTGVVPTVALQVRPQVGVGSIAFTGAVPSLGVDIQRDPAVGSIALTGIAPDVALLLNITPAAGAIIFAGAVPTVALQVRITPAAGAVIFTELLPDVAALLNITPPVGAITLSSVAPDVALLLGITPPAGAITFAGAVPDVGTGLRVLTTGPGVKSAQAVRAASSVAITFDEAPAEGDLIILMMSVIAGSTSSNPTNDTVTWPSGFAQAHRQELTSPTGNAAYAEIQYKVAGASEGTTYTISDFATDEPGGWSYKGLCGVVVTGWTDTITLSSSVSGSADNSGGSTTGTGEINVMNAPLIVASVMAAENPNTLTTSSWGTYTERMDLTYVDTGPDGVFTAATHVSTTTGAFSDTVTWDSALANAVSVQVAFTDGGDNIDPSPDLGDIVLTGITPDVALQVRITPPAGLITFTGFAPGLSAELMVDVGSIIFTGYIPDCEGGVAIVTRTGGGASTTAGKRRRRRVLIDGKRYMVRDRLEERRLLEQWRAQQEQQLETAEAAHKPAIRKQIKRITARIAKVDADPIVRLIEEDEEILEILAGSGLL